MVTAALAGTLQVGALAVHRMGFGAMRLPGVAGRPADPVLEENFPAAALTLEPDDLELLG